MSVIHENDSFSVWLSSSSTRSEITLCNNYITIFTISSNSLNYLVSQIITAISLPGLSGQKITLEIIYIPVILKLIFFFYFYKMALVLSLTPLIFSIKTTHFLFLKLFYNQNTQYYALMDVHKPQQFYYLLYLLKISMYLIFFCK